MKSLNLIVVVTIALIALGCFKDDSSDDSKNLTFDGLIVGEWKVSDIYVSGTVTFENILGTEQTNLYLESINYNNYLANFFGSPNFISPSGSLGITVSADFWDLGETFSKEISDILVFNAGSWSTDSNILLVSSGNETHGYGIINVNDTTMTISTVINSEMDIYELKTPIAIYLIISFSKI